MFYGLDALLVTVQL